MRYPGEICDSTWEKNTHMRYPGEICDSTWEKNTHMRYPGEICDSTWEKGPSGSNNWASVASPTLGCSIEISHI